jgi:hypothetical protein
MTYKEKLGWLLDGARRELAYQKRLPNPDPNAIAISERDLERKQADYDLFSEECRILTPITPVS